MWNYSKIYTTRQSTTGRRPCVEVSIYAVNFGTALAGGLNLDVSLPKTPSLFVDIR
jgi:hypothetical protein